MSTDYESNSHKYKEEQEAKKEGRKVEAVAKAVVRKKSKSRKFLDAFVPEDVEDVGSYIMSGVIVPSIKRIIWQTFGTILFGKNNYGPYDNRGYGEYPERVSYTRFFDDERSYNRRQAPRRTGGNHIYHWDDLLYETPEDAEFVLSRLEDDIRQGYTPSVQDLYEYSNLTAPWSAAGWGWTNIRSAEVVTIGDKFAIRLPRPLPID